MTGFGLPHLHYAHDCASLATACMEQVRHLFSISCGAPRRCARASAVVCSQEEIISTSTCAHPTTAVVTNSSRARLRASSTLSVSSSRKSCANLIFILAVVTRAATKLPFPLHMTWSITSERLGHVSSSTQVVVQAYLQISTMPVHQAGISFSWPPAPCLDSLC